MKRKIYLIILDGAADRPILALGNRTPIEAASTPHLDEMARQGEQGLLTIIDSSICPESDNGAMALLSYDPLIYYTGRGPLEGLGADFLGLSDNSVCFRVNFASYNEQTQQLDRRTARALSDEELQLLISDIKEHVSLSGFDDVTFDLLAFRRHRGIMCFRSNTLPLSGNVTNTDPGFRKVGPFGIPVPLYQPEPLACTPMDESNAARNVAALVNVFVQQSRQILNQSIVNRQRIARGELPANILLFRDGGSTPPALPLFSEKFHCSLSFYGQIPAERGLMQLLGGRFTYSMLKEGADEATYLRTAVQQVIDDESDVVFIHLKSPDEPGHDGLPLVKTQAIAAIDQFFIGPLLDRMQPDDLCIVTSDHATPCELGIHSADPVPTVLFEKASGNHGFIQPDATTAFGEQYARDGSLPVQRAVDLLPYVFAKENL